MTSELRPALAVWNGAWDALTGTPPASGNPNAPFQAAAAVIEADREAVRAEMRQALIATGEAAAAHLKEAAKFKALAETLATDLRECAKALQSLHQIPGTGADGRLRQRIKEITDAAHAAVAQYKEASDAS